MRPSAAAPAGAAAQARVGAALPALRRARSSRCPPREDAPLRPTSVYGITKRDQEELALVLGRAYGIETVALRYLNVYGPRQALGNPYTGVAAIFAARRAERKAAAGVRGRRPDARPGARLRRGAGHAAAMDAPGAPGHAINVATGRAGRRASSLARRIAASAGLRPRAGDDRRVPGRRHPPLLRRRRPRPRAARLRGRAPRWSRACPSWPSGWRASRVPERGDEALADLRARGLVG